ncbi:MAG TPA: TerC family protein [Pirellulales bacterium]|nr:TerC family protein [Pirellulales bacterium]
MVHIPLWYWFAFGAFVTTMLVIDLSVIHRSSRKPTAKESGLWTLFWCALAVGFSVLVWWIYTYYSEDHDHGLQKAGEFLSGYAVEWALSMDNVFVFVVIFNHFRVPPKFQYRVLFWGILGAVFLRLAFVLAGAALIHRFEWILYVLGAFLVYTGVMLAVKDEEVDPEKGFALRLSRRFLPVASGDHTVHGDRFFVRVDGRMMATPLFLVLVVINITDVIFAVDSVPAIFGITKDPFIVFTSNVFAIFGLRALYFLLADFMGMFHYLKYGLSLILIFVGVKMLAKLFLDHDNLLISNPFISLAVIAVLLGGSIVASILFPERHDEAPAHGGPNPE